MMAPFLVSASPLSLGVEGDSCCSIMSLVEQLGHGLVDESLPYLSESRDDKGTESDRGQYRFRYASEMRSTEAASPIA